MPNCNVLISSVGRRSQLIACFRQSLRSHGIDGRLIGIDAGLNAPARFLVDQFHQVPRCSDAGFIDAVQQICIREQVGLLVPTIDTELMAYACGRAKLEQTGALVCLSSPTTIAIASDKIETNRWLRANGFPTVAQALPSVVLESDSAAWRFPVILKPRRGSASVGVQSVSSPALLECLLAGGTELIVEEKAQGREFTINVYVNREGHCVCAVPHWRIEVRAGEVSKGITVRNEMLIELGTRIGNRLPGAFGALNVQAFVDDDDHCRVTEINARFGGGYPLAHRAGADMTTWLLEEALRLPSSAKADQWLSGMMMLRYDDAVFLSLDASRACL